ncbi:MAG: sigma-54-dependent Fis family transcriptional regulator [Chlorobi bacterium]|nr:sigma-54-dependent Fis family transcriptional regulator [Chlorobiota bacterium]
MTIQQVKQRFGIIGNDPALNRAIDIAMQVAPTDLTVLVTGESGTGKEMFPQIIHQLSARKHNRYIAVNCGAIPEGTIDSELFGHEKGSFTGAVKSRKGYFEEADGGTIFLDEVGELPLSTQVRLLRVLETGEYIKVGSSQVLKTDVRVIVATNVNLPKAVQEGKFREDLYYRLNTVPIIVPPLRERKEDIHLLFRKFAQDFSEKYRMPVIRLDDKAKLLLENYSWKGNVRQLKNIAEQISIIEEDRLITYDVLKKYLPEDYQKLPMVYGGTVNKEDFANEREILYKILFDMRNEINELKSIVKSIAKGDKEPINISDNFFTEDKTITKIQGEIFDVNDDFSKPKFENPKFNKRDAYIEDTEEIVEESLSLKDKEIELIKKSLEKHKGKRKYAAQELGISERTLYRKLKEYNINTF